MPNFINTLSSPSYQDLHFIINDINNNYTPIVNNNYTDLSSWITHLLIQELNDNDPVTTEIITNFINNEYYNDTPNDTPNDSSNDTPPPATFSTILNHDDDQDLYDTDYSSDDDGNSPIGIYESSNHIIP